MIGLQVSRQVSGQVAIKQPRNWAGALRNPEEDTGRRSAWRPIRSRKPRPVIGNQNPAWSLSYISRI